MTDAHIWVLIPAARQHIGHLRESLELLGNLANHAVIVTNGQHPLTEHEIYAHVLQAGMDINISRWWNMGLDWIVGQEGNTRHHVLVLNADTRIKPEGVARLSWALDQYPEVVMAGPKADFGTEVRVDPGPTAPHLRVPGWCFMLTSDHPIRADEQFRWWCGDDDLEWRARQEGGALRVGRIEAAHLGDGQPRGRLLELAREDLLRFEEKWGIRPW